MVKASTLGARFCEVCSQQNFHFRSQSHLTIHSHTSKVHPDVRARSQAHEREVRAADCTCIQCSRQPLRQP